MHKRVQHSEERAVATCKPELLVRTWAITKNPLNIPDKNNHVVQTLEMGILLSYKGVTRQV